MSNVFPTTGAVPGVNEYQPISPALAAIYRLYSAPRGACRPSLDLDAFNGILEEIAALYDLSGLAGDALGAGSKLLPNGFGNLANAVKMMAWKAQTPCLSEITALGIVPANGFPRAYVDDSGVSSVIKQWDCKTLSYIEVGANHFSQCLTLAAGVTLTPAQFNYLVKMTGSSGFTVTLPTPVSNGGKGRYVFYNASSATQTITTPAGVIGGPFGSGTSSMTLAAGATLVIISDGVDWIASASSVFSLDPGIAGIGAIRGATVHYTFCNILDVVSGSSIASYRTSIIYNGHLIHDASPELWPGSWRALANTYSDGFANAWIFQRVA